MKARSHEKKDEITDAKKFIKLSCFPFQKIKSSGQTSRLSINHKILDIIQNPPQEIIDRLINFNNQGHFETMANEAKALTEQYPNALLFGIVLVLQI